MSEPKTYAPPSEHASKTLPGGMDEYRALYSRSLEDPQGFYAEMAQRFLTWDQPFDEGQVASWDLREGRANWFAGGRLNASVNCLDRHLAERGEQTAVIWESDDGATVRRLTYRELHEIVCRFANVLRARGVGKGDRVCIYMPMIPEAAAAMLACARIGAIHSVVFGGFSPDSIRDRVLDADCSCVITADGGNRGGREVALKENVDAALQGLDGVHSVVVVRHLDIDVPWQLGRDCWYHEQAEKVGAECEPESMDSEDPLFILYTSGSTGKPKGVQHGTAGYLLHAALTFQYLFDYRPGEVFWCTADVGWVTGHSYIVYGPLAQGATSLMYEGLPNHPDASRCWQMVERHQVAVFYTAPTALRALMVQGAEPVRRHSRDSLRLLGTVGEPINPEAWEWYHETVGEGRCQIVDTWWQTETGAAMIAPLAGVTPTKPGSATLPMFGVEPVLLDEQGAELEGATSGLLAIKRGWPAQIRTVYGDHQRLVDTYLARFPGYYLTGDGARRDEDGYWWITGRVDDVLNVSGHRLGTTEIESALVEHEAVAEAAVVGFPHEIKGEAVHAYVTLMASGQPSEELRQELRELVSKIISPIAKPDRIQWAPQLPKTRSGKIMRRILRKIASGETEDLGDTTTLADPSVVEQLVADAGNA